MVASRSRSVCWMRITHKKVNACKSQSQTACTVKPRFRRKASHYLRQVSTFIFLAFCFSASCILASAQATPTFNPTGGTYNSAQTVKSGNADNAIGSVAYTINLTKVATPTFSPIAGTYNSAQAVTISDATSGTTIYYTTNGTTPTASSRTYSGPIAVSVSETVKALGIRSAIPIARSDRLRMSSISWQPRRASVPRQERTPRRKR